MGKPAVLELIGPKAQGVEAISEVGEDKFSKAGFKVVAMDGKSKEIEASCTSIVEITGF